ncbi:hypothetical protein JG687_00017520 [Phytophthora cactorum]|uniref:Uncharacterized protein n=1 Tax=Phytophthora cactorum TaxID=29920 RepID=A0A8T1TQ22_9STRA|nr:hypothetical protein JG687_00017520 [Phytophthora cactorum]
MSRSQHIIYTVDLLSNNVEKGMKLLVDAILNVDLVQEETEGIKWMRSAVQVLIKKLGKSVKPELDKDPFETLDQESVGNQVRLVVKLGRGTRSHIELGFCGENGGKP